MKMLSVISLKRKDEPLLPQTVETTVEGLTDQGSPKKEKSGAKAKVTITTTKTKKKKFLKSCMAGASSVFQLVLFLVLWLTPGRILTLLS